MATIYNTELLKELKNGARIQQIKDVIPSQLAEKVVPVMEVNPRLLKICNVVANVEGAGGNSTLYAVPADKRFFLVACNLSRTKVAGDAGTDCNINVTLPTGQTGAKVLSICGVTLTAAQDSVATNFPIPIEIKPGTNILLSSAGATTRHAGTLVGYTIENVTA